MAFELNSIKTDETLESEGVWTDVVSGLRVKLARMGNPEYMQFIRTETRKRTANGLQELAASDAVDIGVKAMARFVLLDWENLQEDGADLPYSVDTAERVLRVRDFRAIIEQLAASVVLFREANIKETAGN